LIPTKQIPAGEPGIVYVLTDASGLYKIGRTVDLAGRLRDIALGNPTVRVIAYFETHNAPAVELLLHGFYASSRVVGEWFDLAGVVASRNGT
jgi:hypothetical protein